MGVLWKLSRKAEPPKTPAAAAAVQVAASQATSTATPPPAPTAATEAQAIAVAAATKAATAKAAEAARASEAAKNAARREAAVQAEQAVQRAAELQAEREALVAAAQAEDQARRAEAAAASAAARLAPPSTVERRPEDTLVMVADDSKVVRVKTSRLLAQFGYRVVLAEDGTQAAQLIEHELPVVLITDVEMPGMDGFELTRHVRAHPRAAGIPIIMITSADDRLKQAAAEAGVTLVLGKPYPEEQLIACIENARLKAPLAAENA